MFLRQPPGAAFRCPERMAILLFITLKVEKMSNESKGRLSQLWRREAPWYVKVLRTGTLTMAGLVGLPPALSLLPGDPLPEIQRAPLEEFYRATVDTRAVKIHSSLPSDLYLRLIGAEAVTFGTGIFIREEVKNQLEKQNSIFVQYVLAHELAHVRQSERSHLVGYNALKEKLGSLLAGNGLYGHYHYSLKEDRPLEDYGIEQQASILADYYIISKGQPPLFLTDTPGDPEEIKTLYEKKLSGFFKERQAAQPVAPGPGIPSI